MTSNPRQPAPLYRRFSDLFNHGFTFDWVTAVYITVSNVIALVGLPLALWLAPEGVWKVMLAWMIGHFVLASLSITLYNHRLISHRAAHSIAWPVHLLFGIIGQTMSSEGSIRQWAANHVVHHSVDRTQKHHLDPYSATWFDSAWRNFLWSHMLTFFFFHPQSDERDRVFESRQEPALVWQDRYYVPLLVLFNFLVPMTLGFVVAGFAGAVCLMVASVTAYVLVQHNTWTVNSVTHMWGFTRGASSSAKNNFIWLGPLGEGNHHADHHDYARDYRNGFGWSGWLLDPTRYGILALNALGLVGGLQRASKKREAEIVARRKLWAAKENALSDRSDTWEAWESKLEKLKSEWLEATHQWEAFRVQRLQLRKRTLPQLELQKKLQALKGEMEIARRAMQARRQAFMDALYEFRVVHGYAT